jgi:general stress protein CsbA
MNTYRERLAELSLTLQQQSLLLSELRAHLGDDNDRDVAVGLIGELRRRNDITESIGREIDALLATLASSAASTTSATTTTQRTSADHEHTTGSASSGAVSAGWNPDPFNRHQQRYWDGARWTEHVADNGQRSIDPPTATATPLTIVGAPVSGGRPPGYVSTGPSSPASVGPFSPGAFVGLIVASLFCFGIVGLVVGLINVSKEARRTQAVWLIVIGAVSFFIGLAVATASSSSGSEF